MENYKQLGYKILNEGSKINGRNGVVYSLFGEQLKFDLTKGFPLMTSKYINFNHIKHEVIWYLMGTDKIDYLKEHKIHIWDKWADKNNSIGPTYGVQWRNFNGRDQVKEVINGLIHKPFSRRHIINGWNPNELHLMALPPCIVMIHFNVDSRYRLHAVVYQRSADFAVGVPYDIAEMALLTHYIANEALLEPGSLTMQYGNIHIYGEHVETLKEQLKAEYDQLPVLKLEHNDLATAEVVGYNPGKKYKYEVKE
jgi:thymidylate synthase